MKKDRIVVRPAGPLRGILDIPGDKSISHRSIMMGSLARGRTLVENFLSSADCLSTAALFRSMGVRIRIHGRRVLVEGAGLNGLKAPRAVLDAGNSGTTARILLGLLSAQAFTSRLTGDRYLRRRPMRRVVEPLSRMGAVITGGKDDDHLPLTLRPATLKGITYRSPVSSAQVKSAILMAGLFAMGTTKVVEPVPSRDHTERMFRLFGLPLRQRGRTVSLKGPVGPFRARRILVPGDISSASFFLVAGLITPGARLLLRNVGINPTRTGILDVLKRMGARISILRRRGSKGAEPMADLLVEYSRLKGVTVGGALVPRMIDEFPVLAVAATQAEGLTLVKDAGELRVKESDRIASMEVNLRRMGAEITATKDGWIIQGPNRLKGGVFDSFGDHRIAMSLAVAGLVADSPVTVLDTKNVATSFPTFEKLLKRITRT